MADKEAGHVVVGVDKPAGEVGGFGGADVAGTGIEQVHALDLHLDAVVGGGQDIDVRLAENHEQVAVLGLLEVRGHVQVGVHTGFEYGQVAELVGFGGLGVVVEGAADQHVETGVASLARGGDEIGAANRSVLRADEDSGAAFVFTFLITAFGADEIPRPTGEREGFSFGLRQSMANMRSD